MDCSIVIPVFNEQGTLRILQQRLDRVLKLLPGRKEIIYVDDGSSDGSLQILHGLKQEYPDIKVIARSRRGGQSAALKDGLDASRGEWVAMLDADLQNPPEELLKLYAHKDDFDYLVGSRVHRRDRLTRRLASWLGFLVRRLLLGDRVKDAGCTLKLFRRHIFTGFPFGRDWHYFMTCWVQWRGLRLKVVPVAHVQRPSGHSKYTWRMLVFHGWAGLLDFRKAKNPSCASPAQWVIIACLILFPKNACAYIDPGYGNYVAGSLAAAVMGFLSFISAFAIYFFRKLLPGFFGRLWRQHRMVLVSCVIIVACLVAHILIHQGRHGWRGDAPVARGSQVYDSRLSGARVIDAPRVSPGYNLYDGRLIDLHGRLVKKWSSVFMGTLDTNGDYYAQKYFESPVWGRYSWDDKVIWEKHFPIHHQLLLTGQHTVLALTKEMHLYKGRKVEFDVILEFDKDGRLLRRYSTWEHFQELFSYHGPLNADRSIEAHRPDDFTKSPWGGNFDYYHMNFVSVVPDNALKDINPALEPGNWVVTFRHGDMIFVVNPRTGKIVWHIFRKDVPGEIQGVHATQVLANGNMIILDNGTYRSWSRVIELNLMTKQIVWEYNAQGFFSYTQNHIQVLDNGNFLVTESEKGHVFELTRDKKVVWEYYNPLRQNTWVDKGTLADCGLDADAIFSILIAHHWLRPLSYSQASLTQPVTTFRDELKKLFPQDFAAIHYILTQVENGKSHEYREEIYRMRRYPNVLIGPLSERS